MWWEYFNRLDVTYEPECMATPPQKNRKILETLVDYNNRYNAPFSNEKIQQAVSKVMAETEEEECNTKRNTNNVNIDTFCNQSPVTTNTQGYIENMTNERRIPSDILAETIKGFNGLTIQLTIND